MSSCICAADRGSQSWSSEHDPNRKLPFDVARDFAAVCIPNSTQLLLIVHESVPAKSVKDLFALTRAKPQIPTIAEAGVPGYEIANWYGVLAPRATPRPIIEALHASIVKAVASPDLRDRLIAEGGDPTVIGPAAFEALIQKALVRWAKVVAHAGAKVD